MKCAICQKREGNPTVYKDGTLAETLCYICILNFDFDNKGCVMGTRRREAIEHTRRKLGL